MENTVRWMHRADGQQVYRARFSAITTPEIKAAMVRIGCSLLLSVPSCAIAHFGTHESTCKGTAVTLWNAELYVCQIGAPAMPSAHSTTAEHAVMSYEYAMQSCLMKPYDTAVCHAVMSDEALRHSSMPCRTSLGSQIRTKPCQWMPGKSWTSKLELPSPDSRHVSFRYCSLHASWTRCCTTIAATSLPHSIMHQVSCESSCLGWSPCLLALCSGH